MMSLDERSQSLPTSPLQVKCKCSHEECLLVENEHLRQQITLLQFEINKKSTKLLGNRNSVDDDSNQLDSSTKANQLTQLTIRFNTTQSDLLSAQRKCAQLEARNQLLEEQLETALLLRRPPSPVAVATTPAAAATTTTTTQEVLHIQPQPSEKSSTSAGGGSSSGGENENEECVHGLQLPSAEKNQSVQLTSNHRPPTNTTTTAASTRLLRPTYGSSPAYQEIRDAYNTVTTAQTAEEDPVRRWVRTVMSSSSAVDTDPRSVEPRLLGFQTLCEEQGLPFPLHRVGPCQYVLGNGVKLTVRLINFRLMARKGTEWVDIFTWLAKQPLPQLC